MDPFPHVEFELRWVRDFAIAMLIGALIGLEREHRREVDEGKIAGLRTFVLVALAGALTGWLARDLGHVAVLAVGLAAVTVLVVAAYHHWAIATGQRGLTTAVAALVTFLLGAAAVTGHTELAVMLGVGTSAVLGFKESLHGAVRWLDVDDVVAILKLLTATFIVLPLLPDQAVDPWGALNPYELWWLVILIASLSLVGYLAVRLVGPERGLAITGLVGGMVSSTAVALSFARRSTERDLPGALAAGVLLSWSMMFVRLGVLVAVVQPSLFVRELWVPLTVGLLATAVGGWAYAARGGAAGERQQLPVRNPFRLTAAIAFGLFFAAVRLLVEIVRLGVPDEALYAVAAVSGTMDVDAITLSVAQAAGVGLPAQTAVGAILLAAVANTGAKVGIVGILGSRGLLWRVALGAAATLGVGGVAYVVARWV